MLGDQFDNLLESINTSVANRLFEVIHLYPTREAVESEIVRIRQVLPKVRESIQRVRVLKLVAEDIDRLGMRLVGFDPIPVDGAEVFIFDSEEQPAEGWGMKSTLLEFGSEDLYDRILQAMVTKLSPLVGKAYDVDKLVSNFARSWGISREEAIDFYNEASGEDHLDTGDIFMEAKVEEADKVDRQDAEQTMKPQEDDSEVLVPDHMEDYSKEGEEEKGSKSKGTENELTELPDEKLDHEVKYESSEPLHLCNDCFKTFRSNESKCTECESNNVNRLVEEDALVLDEESSQTIKYYEKARSEGKSREDAIQIAAQGMNIPAPKVRNILLTQKVDTVEMPVEEERGEVTHLKKIYNVKFTKDGKEEETRHMGFSEDEVRKEMEKNPKIKVIGMEFVKEGKLEEMAIAGAIYVNKKTGDTVRIDYIGLNDETGEAVIQINSRGVKLPDLTGKEFLAQYSMELVKEKKVNPPEAHMGQTDEKLSVDALKATQGPVLRFDYGTAANHEDIMEDLVTTDFFITRMVGSRITLVNARGIDMTFAKDGDQEWKEWVDGYGFMSESREEISRGEEREIRLSFGKLVQAGMSSSDALAKVSKDYDTSWEVVGKVVGLGEAKLDEQDNDYSVAGKGISDEQSAKDLARDKGGIVVPDDEDSTKFQVIVKEE